jgi:hypothetical protein
VERHLPAALVAVALDERFEFFLAVRLWTDRLAQEGVAHIKVSLPTSLPTCDTDGMSDVARLGRWFTDEAQKIAQRFDARNGNDHFQKQLEESSQLLKLAAT